MTRKKFVKQLMALGYQRNDAEALATYARCGGWTYEQYLKVERKYNGQLTALQTAAGRMAAWFAEGLEHLAIAVQKVADHVHEVFAGINMGNITTALDWVKENAPQIAERHAGDALDALRYSCGIDLANGPDFTAGGGGHD